MLYLKLFRHDNNTNSSFFAVSELLKAVYGIENASDLIKKACGGKPYIEGADFDFSVADTKDAIVVALAGEGEKIPDVLCLDKTCKKIGVDVECTDRLVKKESMLRVIEKLYGEKEREYVAAGTEGDVGRFLEIWTKKESIVKSTGEGLSAISKADTVNFSGEFLETRYFDFLDKIYIVSIAGI